MISIRGDECSITSTPSVSRQLPNARHLLPSPALTHSSSSPLQPSHTPPPPLSPALLFLPLSLHSLLFSCCSSCWRGELSTHLCSSTPACPPALSGCSWSPSLLHPFFSLHLLFSSSPLRSDADVLLKSSFIFDRSLKMDSTDNKEQESF